MAADPKILLILQALSARLAAIRDTDDAYHTDIGRYVQRGRHRLPAPPACAIYLDSQTVTAAAPARTLIEASIAVEAYSRFEDDEPEDVACRMLEDIRVAVESTDRTLGGLLHLGEQLGIAFEPGDITYPEDQDSIVGVRVVYTAPYIRKAD